MIDQILSGPIKDIGQVSLALAFLYVIVWFATKLIALYSNPWEKMIDRLVTSLDTITEELVKTRAAIIGTERRREYHMQHFEAFFHARLDRVEDLLELLVPEGKREQFNKIREDSREKLERLSFRQAFEEEPTDPKIPLQRE